MQRNTLLALSALAATFPSLTSAQEQPVAIQLELNSAVVVPFKFPANSSVRVNASGRILWNVAENLACGPEGSPGASSFISPPLRSANRGALLAKSSRGYSLVGSSGSPSTGPDGVLELVVNDGYPIDNEGAFVAIVGNKPLEPDYDLASEVAKSDGKVKWNFRQRFGLYMWSERRDEKNGHSYLTISPINGPNIGRKAATELLKERIRDVFPGTAVGSQGGKVTLGNVFTLVVNAPLAPKVRTSAVGTYSFTFQTLPGHPLQGTATHGVFEDSSGQLYMFQQGRGVPNEKMAQQRFNLNVAPTMWQWAAENFGRLIRKLYA